MLFMLCCASAFASTAAAGDIRYFEVTREDGVYTVTTEVIIDAPVQRVRTVLTDYAALPQINDSVKSVQVLSTTPEQGVTRIQSDIYMCVLLFCMNVHQVQDMIDVKPGDLRAFIIVEESNFAHGRSYWRTYAGAQANTTLLHWTAVLEPDFWVPPAIGPLLIRRKLEEEALETIAGIEQVIARQAVNKQAADKKVANNETANKQAAP